MREERKLRPNAAPMEWAEEEREHLRWLAGQLPVSMPSQWLTKASTPAALDRAREQLERRWLAVARRPSQELYRSPPYNQKRPMPGGGEAHFTYERSLWPKPLEERKPPVPPGWEAEVVAVRSRRAALWTFLVTVRDLLRQQVTVRTWGLPEDDLRLLEMLASPRWSWSQAFSQETLQHGLADGRGGLYLVSGVRPDGLESFEPEPFAAAWKAREPEHGAVLLVDTSLLPTFDMRAFLERLERPPLLAAQLTELNGWHTQGLALGSAAWLTFYGLEGIGLTDCQTAAELGRRVRSVLGTALSFAELCQLDVPFLGWDPAWFERVVANGSSPSFTAYAGLRPEGLLGLLPDWRRGPKAPPRSQPTRARKPLASPTSATRTRFLTQADTRTGSVAELEGRLPGPGLLFRSAMAAISSLLALLEHHGVVMQAQYFETRFLHHVVGAEEQGALFAESVEYNWELRPLELPASLPEVTIIDTTLTGERFPVPAGAIRLFSALKLHQRGLELENCGALVLPSPDLKPWLQEFRRLTDTGLTPVEAARLDVPFFLTDHDYAERVFANNAWLARQLRPHPGLVSRVVHPSLFSDLPWAVAPFLVLHLADEAIDNHRLLAAVLEHEGRGLPFDRGASFGFVRHRHEFIIPVLKENRALFKIAMGSGPGREAIAALLERVLAFPSFAALQAAYPRLDLAPPPTDWATPSPALLEFLEEED